MLKGYLFPKWKSSRRPHTVYIHKEILLFIFFWWRVLFSTAHHIVFSVSDIINFHMWTRMWTSPLLTTVSEWGAVWGRVEVLTWANLIWWPGTSESRIGSSKNWWLDRWPVWDVDHEWFGPQNGYCKGEVDSHNRLHSGGSISQMVLIKFEFLRWHYYIIIIRNYIFLYIIIHYCTLLSVSFRSE
jgi:hypothetical protein